MHIHNHLWTHSNRARDTTLVQPLHDTKQKLFTASKSSGITTLWTCLHITNSSLSFSDQWSGLLEGHISKGDPSFIFNKTVWNVPVSFTTGGLWSCGHHINYNNTEDKSTGTESQNRILLFDSVWSKFISLELKWILCSVSKIKQHMGGWGGGVKWIKWTGIWIMAALCCYSCSCRLI